MGSLQSFLRTCFRGAPFLGFLVWGGVGTNPPLLARAVESLQSRVQTTKAPSPLSPTRSALKERLTKALQERLQADFSQPLEIDIRHASQAPVESLFSSPFASSIPFSDFRINKISFDPHSKGFHAEVVFLSSPHESYTSHLSGSVTFMRRIPVFKDRVSPGDAISVTQFHWQTLPDDHRVRNVITDHNILKNAVAKRPIRPGDMPQMSNIKTTQVIEKNTPVELVYQSDRLHISLPGGRALSKGRLGDMVFVSHHMAKKGHPISGIVEPNQRVRIIGPGF